MKNIILTTENYLMSARIGKSWFFKREATSSSATVLGGGRA